jgi:hypothetical protein
MVRLGRDDDSGVVGIRPRGEELHDLLDQEGVLFIELHDMVGFVNIVDQVVHNCPSCEGQNLIQLNIVAELK